MKKAVAVIKPVLGMILMFILGGCSEPDERLIQMSEQSLARQAEQNRQMARHHDQLTEATRRLVESDAEAREELIQAHGELQQGVQAERLDLSQQQAELQRRHDALEAERRQIAVQRQRDPVIAGAIYQATILLVCCLPLVLCFCLLRALGPDDRDSALGELLVEDFLADQSLLRAVDESPRQAIEHKPLPLDASDRCE